MIKAVIFDMYETLITHYKTPLYFSEAMSQDMGISYDAFYPLWKQTESMRSVGKMTFEQCIEYIMKENDCFSLDVLNLIVKKRQATKVAVFDTLHDEIIPMLERLKAQGIQIGLISNCFSEEVIAIRKSKLASYFDSMCLSYERGYQKPDLEIFQMCMDELHVQANECIYIGDGGSCELETALKLGMHPLQAAWYFQEGLAFQSKVNPAFTTLYTPMDLFQFVKK